MTHPLGNHLQGILALNFSCFSWTIDFSKTTASHTTRKPAILDNFCRSHKIKVFTNIDSPHPSSVASKKSMSSCMRNFKFSLPWGTKMNVLRLVAVLRCKSVISHPNPSRHQSRRCHRRTIPRRRIGCRHLQHPHRPTARHRRYATRALTQLQQPRR